MCHLKCRKVISMRQAIMAFHDNEDKTVLVTDIKPHNPEEDGGFVCEDQGRVEDTVEMFFGAGSEFVYMAPCSSENHSLQRAP
jgi:hypothetical protein